MLVGGLKYTCGDTEINLEDIKKIGRDAANAIMQIYQNEEDWDIRFKSKDNSPLTSADLEANKIICDGLTALYPKIPIISEENKQVPFEERMDWEYFFCVDPLDGTKEFINRNGQFTVNIGLCEKGRPVLGLVIVPAVESPVMYYGMRGESPCVEELIDSDMGYDSFRTIRCREFTMADEGLTVVASASHNSPETEKFISQFKNPKVTSMGSSLKLLLVAEGKAHVYPRLALTSEWDTCAAQAIVEAAGGQVLQQEGGPECEHGEPVRYNKPDPLNPFFICRGKLKQPKTPRTPAKETSSVGFKQYIPLIVILIAVVAYLLLKQQTSV